MTVKELIEVLSELDILTDKACSKIYYHYLSRRDKNNCYEFFSHVVKLCPDSYEIRRCLAESMMNLGRFNEAVAEWKYIIEKLGKKNPAILFRLFRSYMGIGNIEEMEQLEKEMSSGWPEQSVSVKTKDMFLSYCNERFEIKVTFEKKLQELSEVIGDLSERLCMKRKEFYQLCLSRVVEGNIPYIIINYKNGGVTRLYPIVMEDGWKFEFNNLAEVSNFVLHMNNSAYRAQVSSKRIIGVLQGKDGWLFLDNDTNKSVEQFCGRCLMSNEVLDEWREYLRCARELSGFILFVPPSKESVFPQFYPYTKGSYRPIDQLKELVNEGDFAKGFFYPCDILAEDSSNYSKTETHYTYKGAKLCFEKIAEKYFDVDIEKIKLKSFQFESRDNIGDLGSKLSPIRTSKFIFLRNSKRQDYLVYSNGIENTGRVEYYKNNTNCLSDKKLIIFGDSFSYCITPYFYNYFREILVCRTVGTVHMDIVEKFRPDYIISEMTERFIIRAPKIFMGEEARLHSLSFDYHVF